MFLRWLAGTSRKWLNRHTLTRGRGNMISVLFQTFLSKDKNIEKTEANVSYGRPAGPGNPRLIAPP